MNSFFLINEEIRDNLLVACDTGATDDDRHITGVSFQR